jgi:hypothetical protein
MAREVNMPRQPQFTRERQANQKFPLPRSARAQFFTRLNFLRESLKVVS